MGDGPDPRLAGLTAPPGDPDFHEELWDKIGRREGRMRHLRRVGLALVVGAALVTASAAGVFAFGEQSQPLDRTLSCPVPEQGGVNLLYLTVHVKAPPLHFKGKTIPSPAIAQLSAGAIGTAQLPYVFVASLRNSIGFDQTVCRTAPSIPLVRAGLPLAGTFRGADGSGIARECWLGTTIAVRLRVKLGPSGVPIAAQLALRSGAKQRPVAYVDWTPTVVQAYLSPSCEVR